MEFILFLQDKLSFVWEYGLPFLIALTILVFVHEFGHYIVARWCGVRVEVFSIGFGPEIKGWTDKKGTRWKLAYIPLGGYVKMFGERDTIEEEEEGDVAQSRPMSPDEKKVSFFHKSLSQRASIVVAGPLINLIFAVVAFSFLYLSIGVPTPVSEKPLAVVGSVSPGSAAFKSNLRKGDQIEKINESKINFFSDLQNIVRSSPNKPLNFIILREKKTLYKTIVPGSRIENDQTGNSRVIGVLGITSDNVRYEKKGVVSSLVLGFERTYFMTGEILRFIGRLFLGNQSTDELGGIIRIAQISGQVAELGIASYISFLAILSINLGLINLFPIPLLDGGHLAFYLIEFIRGRPLGDKAQEYGLKFGLAMVIGLFLFVTWNDLVHIRFFEFISEVFG